MYCYQEKECIRILPNKINYEKNNKDKKYFNKRYAALYITLLSSLLYLSYNPLLSKKEVEAAIEEKIYDDANFTNDLYKLNNNTLNTNNLSKLMSSDLKSENKQIIINSLPIYLRYQEINVDKLQSYLEGRNSILSQSPYFETIVDVSMEYNINPLLMFAITGQEQSFVPDDKNYSRTIANNPFNVHGSWVKYNTDIRDSSEIAAGVILKLSKGRPDGYNAFQWINKKYAEDQNWYISVEKIFNMLNDKCSL
ncbi:hypothetical protein [Clostridium sp. DL1XJH146]